MSRHQKDSKEPAKPGSEESGQPASKQAVYVLASGPKFGACVDVVPLGEPSVTENGARLQTLALPETPERIYQTKARYSEKKEPGTWHYR